MKTKNYLFSLVTLVALIISVPVKVNCQTNKTSFHIDKITVSEGKGAMTSGLDFVISMSADSLSKAKGLILMAQANNERANVRIGKSFGIDSIKFGQVVVLGTVGAFKNVPWAGAMVLYNYKFNDFWSVDACIWAGFGMSTDNQLTDPGWNPNFFFNYLEGGLNFGKNRVSYGNMLFTTNTLDHYLVYRRTFTLSKKSNLFAETTYDIRKELPMFVIGLKYSFAKK